MSNIGSIVFSGLAWKAVLISWSEEYNALYSTSGFSSRAPSWRDECYAIRHDRRSMCPPESIFQ